MTAHHHLSSFLFMLAAGLSIFLPGTNAALLGFEHGHPKIFGFDRSSARRCHVVQHQQWESSQQQTATRRSAHQYKLHDSIENIRGGDLGSITGESLATVLCGLAGLDAVTGLLAPYTSLQWMGVNVTIYTNGEGNGKSSFKYTRLSQHYMHGIGTSALSLAVALGLTVNKVVPLPIALGYGLLVRLVSTTYLLLSGECREMGMSDNVFVVLALVLAVTTYHLMGGTGFGDILGELLGHFGGDKAAMNLVKVLSYFFAVHGYFLFSAPQLFVQRAIHRQEAKQGVVDVAGKKKQKTEVIDKQDLTLKLTTNLASINGGYMAMSGAVMYLLAHGMNPVQVAGMTSLGFLPIVQKALKTIVLSVNAQDGVTKLLGIIHVDATTIWGGGMVVSALLGAIAIGCLSSVPLSPSPPLGSPSLVVVPPVAIPLGPPTPPIAE